MKYKTRLLLLLFCIYGFICCVFYLQYRIGFVFRDQSHPRERIPRHQKNNRVAEDQLDAVHRRNGSRAHHSQPMSKNLFPSKSGLKTCREKQNFVFIKCMKCATETLETIFRRFGFVRDLIFVLPVGQQIYLGWPYLMEPGHYKPPRKRPSCPQCPSDYNILCEHAVYNRTSMRLLMPPDTVYITIIREPFSRLVSTFKYFAMKELLNITQPDALNEYLTNFRKYESIYKSPKVSAKRYCIPNNMSLTENLLAHCLGMPLGFPSDRTSIGSNTEAIADYIKQLDEDFDLVMLVEYFHESLILLRRLMCWTFKDIIYLKVNLAGNKGYQDVNRNTRIRQEQLYRTYSAIDYTLYDYFNRTFWKKVDLQKDDFFDEVRHFEKVHKDISEFCYRLLSSKTNITSIETFFVSPSKWNDGFNFTPFDCNLISRYLLYPLHDRYYKQMQRYPNMKQKSNLTTC